MKKKLISWLLILILALVTMGTLMLRADMIDKHSAPMGTPNPPPRVTPSVTVVPPLYTVPIENEGE